jgi:hypothetical protein
MNTIEGDLFCLLESDEFSTKEYETIRNIYLDGGNICRLDWQNEVLSDALVRLKNTGNEKRYIKIRELFLRRFSKYFVEDGDGMRVNKDIVFFVAEQKNLNMTNEQKNAVRRMVRFLMSRDKTTYGLFGYAGTGKTTIMVELINYVFGNGYVNSVAFTAPTNKAVNVMRIKFQKYLRELAIKILGNKDIANEDECNLDEWIAYLEQEGIKIHFMTIHKLLAYKTDYKIDGTMIFVKEKKKKTQINNYDIILMDECSMIGLNMIDTIFEEINGNYENNKIPKIIFSGDPAQLPPVNENSSSIFRDNEVDLSTYVDKMDFMLTTNIQSDGNKILEERYKIFIKKLYEMETYLLKKVVRSKNKNVTELCYTFRKWIKEDDLPDLEKHNGKKGIQFYDSGDKKDKCQTEWFNTFLGKISHSDNSVVITWTNKQSEQYNEVIRKRKFGKNRLNKFEIGDILILSDHYNLDLGDQYVPQKLYTSEQIKIIKAQKKIIPLLTFEMLNFRGMKKKITEANITLTKTLIESLNVIFCNEKSLSSWVIDAKKLDETDGLIKIFVIDDMDIYKYSEIRKDSHKVILNFTQNLTGKNSKRGSKQLEQLIIKPLWKQWYKIFIDPFANVNYGYSITCHKGQGSNFYDVFVDLEDILKNKDTSEGKRCAYTAVTRTCNELHILV